MYLTILNECSFPWFLSNLLSMARNETRKRVNWEKMNLPTSLRSYASINEGNHQTIYQATLQVMLIDLRPADDVQLRRTQSSFHKGEVFAIGPWGAGNDDVVSPGRGCPMLSKVFEPITTAPIVRALKCLRSSLRDQGRSLPLPIIPSDDIAAIRRTVIPRRLL